MKKFYLIAIAVLLLAFTLSLAGCGSTDAASVNGVYCNVELDGDTANVEVMVAYDGAFVLHTFTTPANGANAAAVKEAITASYQTNGSYANAQDLEEKKGEYTYKDNAFIVRRMSLTYAEGGKEFCYLAESDGSFELSPTIPVILLYCVIGFCVTLTVLLFLMLVIKVLGVSVDKLQSKRKPKEEEKNQEESAPAPVLAKGSAGELKLVGVSEKDAAMIMAIIADQLQVPLNTLKFISITDITDTEVQK